LHGHQEGRFFHGYYDCYCYLPLYIFCGRHLLAAKLRRSNIDASAGAVAEVARIVAQIRLRWPWVRILLRADAGFAREALMRWCEQNRIDYLFALARNERLTAAIAAELQEARQLGDSTGKPARRFKDLMWSTLDSWSRARRVVAKAEWTGGEGQSTLCRHFAILHRARGSPPLREGLLRPRRHGEPHQGMPTRPVRRPHLDRHHARQPVAVMVCRDGLRAGLRVAPHCPQAHPVRPGHLRHHSSQAVQDRRAGTAQRPPHQIAMASACPYQNEFALAHLRLAAAAR
jgi:Transposase DDE domain group 1